MNDTDLLTQSSMIFARCHQRQGRINAILEESQRLQDENRADIALIDELVAKAKEAA